MNNGCQGGHPQNQILMLWINEGVCVIRIEGYPDIRPFSSDT